MSESNFKNLVFGVAGITGLMIIGMVALFMKVNGVENRGASKVGFIKSDHVLAQYKPAMAVQQRLQEETAGIQKDLERRYNELQGINADLEKKSKVLSSAALAPQVESFQRKQAEFSQMQQGFQQSVNQKQSQLLEPIFQDISNFINKYGKDNGYTIIFGTPVDGLIVYGDAANDLTDIILAELNAKVPPSMPVPFNSATDTTRKK